MYKQKWIVIGMTLFLSLFIINSNAFAISQETEKLLKVLEKKNIITNQEASEMKQEMESFSQVVDKDDHTGLLDKWADKIHPGACIEVEASYEDKYFDDPDETDTDTSDLALATVEIGFDVDITKHVKGSLLFLYEEGETNAMDVDEGIITIDGADVMPLYVDFGKMYLPFGMFENHFIRDPLTLELGETNESAVVAGFRNDLLKLSVGAFNGDINKTEEHDRIDNYLASACFTLPETAVPNLNLTAGISWISNIADSNGLQEVIEDEAIRFGDAPIKHYINGFNTFLIVSFLDRFCFNAEYVGAMDDITVHADDFDLIAKPEAWTIELACDVNDSLNLAVCYEGSDDCGDFLPKKQFGGVASYELFKHTSVAFEYLYGKYDNKDKRHLLTTLLAIEF